MKYLSYYFFSFRERQFSMSIGVSLMLRYILYPSDHELRNAWIGPSFPLDLSTLPVRSQKVPLQYPSLGMWLLEHPALLLYTDIISLL